MSQESDVCCTTSMYDIQNRCIQDENDLFYFKTCIITYNNNVIEQNINVSMFDILSVKEPHRFPSSATCAESETMSDTEEAPPPPAPRTPRVHTLPHHLRYTISLQIFLYQQQWFAVGIFRVTGNNNKITKKRLVWIRRINRYG